MPVAGSLGVKLHQSSMYMVMPAWYRCKEHVASHSEWVTRPFATAAFCCNFGPRVLINNQTEFKLKQPIFVSQAFFRSCGKVAPSLQRYPCSYTLKQGRTTLVEIVSSAINSTTHPPAWSVATGRRRQRRQAAAAAAAVVHVQPQRTQALHHHRSARRSTST